MKFDDIENKKSRQRRLLVAATVIVGGLTILAIGTQSNAGRCSHAALDQFLANVQERGGSLVRCSGGQCRDVRTGASYGRQQDGLYILYPEGAVSDTELTEQSREVQRLMRDEEQACGSN